jgi:small basic protein (TIGR04137 family)
MTMDRSLKSLSGLKGSRSVLTRAERIAKMQDESRFDPEKNSPFGLPKLRVRTSKAGAKAKKEEAPAEGAAPTAAAAAPAAGAKKADAKKPEAKKPEAKKAEKKK